MKVSTATATATATATDHLRRAAVRATWAHSAYNTQPWRLRLEPTALHLDLDRARQLHVVDPTRRLMIISLGCALFNARAALAAGGVPAEVERFPGGVDGDLVATVRAGGDTACAELAPLSEFLESRYCDQRLFFDDDVPRDVADELRAAAAAEGAQLRPVTTEDDRRAVTALLTHAEAIETLNPAYRAEVRAWTHSGGDLGSLPETAPDSAGPHFLALVCTTGDEPGDWLAAGEALERTLLEAARAGFATRVLVQLTEVPSVRSQLRRDLGLTGYPHVLLRVGRAPAAPMPRRRRLVDVLTEHD